MGLSNLKYLEGTSEYAAGQLGLDAGVEAIGNLTLGYSTQSNGELYIDPVSKMPVNFSQLDVGVALNAVCNGPTAGLFWGKGNTIVFTTPSLWKSISTLWRK